MRMISICIAVLLAAAKVFGACAGHEIASGFNNNVYVEYSATYHYAGHTQYTVTENSDICRIDVSIVGKNGDPSAFNYSASIWSMDGTSLDTRLAQSNTINISANGVKTFTFSTPYTLSPGIDYAITIDHDGDVSETNYVSVSGSNDYWIPGNFAAWATDKTSSASVADDALTMKLYFTQQRGELYMGVLSGDSVTSDYGGNNSVASYLMPNLLISSLSCIAAPANTIAQQDTQWGTDVYKVDYDWIIVMVGLNDLDPAESAATALGRYQTYVDEINTDNSAATLILATMTPCKARLITLYGEEDGATAYQKWLDMNEAIAGGGANAITGADATISAHTAALNDGSGNLDAAYDSGDEIHPNNDGRELIAEEFLKVLQGLGYSSPGATAVMLGF